MEYKYKAKLIRVVDGDTVDFMVDLGFNVWSKQRIRLFGINTPEVRTRNKKEKEAGLRAKAYVQNMLKDAEIEIKAYEKGKYGKYLADIYLCSGKDRVSLNFLLLEFGYVVEYYGGKKPAWRNKV